MKRLLSIVSLFAVIIIQAQEKIGFNKGEITIPIGKEILLKPEIKNNKIIGFEAVKEKDITGKIDFFDMLHHFKKDNIKDNSIELLFSEGQLMGAPIFVLNVIQKTGKKMNFKAKIRLKGSSSYQQTSITPAVSNSAHMEQWKDNIDSIILYDFELN
ncbi:hypothetical protein MKS83_21680 [Chryseobacterium sp. Y16C]|uniref:hypothetical protein n=1 Tax=Chryseobacterium sp. Y16C TaxID=2920939 RepID=UPI001F0A37BB|nr:hypothetical protein [Chryseobacterium sp. Y16C]UMQ41974.1 hypothetical protein MKS83_21680 [Chryseobacterium sp. Y16C]